MITNPLQYLNLELFGSQRYSSQTYGIWLTNDRNESGRSERERETEEERDFDKQYMNVFRRSFLKTSLFPGNLLLFLKNQAFRWPNQRHIWIFQGNSLKSLQMDEQRQGIAHCSDDEKASRSQNQDIL